MELHESINAVLRAEEHENHKKEDFQETQFNNISTLLNIYSREKGKENIVINLIFDYSYPKYSYLGFEFLIRIKEFKKAFEYLEKNLNKIRNSSLQYFSDYYSLFNLCLKRLGFSITSETFTVKEIESLRNQMLDITRLLPKKHQKLGNEYFSNPEISLNESLRTEILKKIDMKKAGLIDNNYNKDLLKEDLEIVVDKIKEMDLGEGIAIAFIKLEEKYYEAKDQTDFAMFGGYIRQTMMGLVKAIALKISEGKEDIIKEKDEQYRNYLKTAGMINEGLWRMLSSFYDFLSMELNHNLETEKEYYKRGLNIASQISYLLLLEYEKFVSESKPI